MSCMNKPCQHCPYRFDVRPFLHEQRGAELALLTQNRYNEFWCHKTTESDDESEDGTMLVTTGSKLCAGFLTLLSVESGDKGLPEGFNPSYELVYDSAYEMMDAYEDSEYWEELCKDRKQYVAP